MIQLDVVSNERQHFIAAGDEPFRIEVSVVNEIAIAEVYQGTEHDLEQEPILTFMGGQENKSAVSEK